MSLAYACLDGLAGRSRGLTPLERPGAAWRSCRGAERSARVRARKEGKNDEHGVHRRCLGRTRVPIRRPKHCAVDERVSTSAQRSQAMPKNSGRGWEDG